MPDVTSVIYNCNKHRTQNFRTVSLEKGTINLNLGITKVGLWPIWEIVIA